MKILCIANSPSSFHRLKLPMSKLKANFATKLTEELFKSYDSVWFHYKCTIHPTTLSQWRLKYGTQIVMDIDDTWNIPLNHPSYEVLKETVKWSKQFATVADWVVCSTPEVESMVKPYNENTLVVPNRIPYGEGQYYVIKESKEDFLNRKIRIGFCGSISHLEDWESISGKLKRVLSDGEVKAKCEFVVCGFPKNIKISESMIEKGTAYAQQKGMDVNKVLDYMEKQHVKRNEGLWNKVRFALGKPILIENRPVENYIDLYREIDILLCPLVDNHLNICKSNLKVYEAACTDTLCILGEGYREKDEHNTAHLFEDWYNNIKFLIKDKKKLYDMKIRTSEYIRNLYDYHEDCVLPRQSILGIKRNLDLNIWGITYKENQQTEYKPYFNTISTVEDKSYFFEANVMAKLFRNEI